MLAKYLITAGTIGIVFAITVVGEAVLRGVTELGEQNSADVPRPTEPYVRLWPY